MMLRKDMAELPQRRKGGLEADLETISNVTACWCFKNMIFQG